MLNVTLVAPDGTVTVLGTIAEVALLASVIEVPPVGAAPVRVTVAVEDTPPTTFVGFKVNEERAAAVTTRFCVLATPSIAVIIAVACPAMGTVEMLNVAIVLPPATTTEAGSVATLLLLARLTAMPPTGAAVARVMVPMELLPPNRDVGLKLNDCNTGGLTVKLAA